MNCTPESKIFKTAQPSPFSAHPTAQIRTQHRALVCPSSQGSHEVKAASVFANQNRPRRKILKRRRAPRKMLAGPGRSERERRGRHGEWRTGESTCCVQTLLPCGPNPLLLSGTRAPESQSLSDFSKEVRHLEFHVRLPKPRNTKRAKPNMSLGETQPGPGYHTAAAEPGWEGSSWLVVQAALGCQW